MRYYRSRRERSVLRILISLKSEVTSDETYKFYLLTVMSPGHFLISFIIFNLLEKVVKAIRTDKPVL